MLYWIYLDRRQDVDDRQAELEHQTFNLFPERWVELYKDNLPVTFADDEFGEEEPVTDIDALDQFFNDVISGGSKQWTNGDRAAPAGVGPYWDSWGDWK